MKIAINMEEKKMGCSPTACSYKNKLLLQASDLTVFAGFFRTTLSQLEEIAPNRLLTDA